jgi:hypothetical protein
MSGVHEALTYVAWLLTGCVALAEDSPAVMREAFLSPGFAEIMRADPALFQNGGAKLIETNGKRYFVSIGFTGVLGESPAERVRQMQVTRIRALKAASEFIGTTILTSEVKLSDTTTIDSVDGEKMAEQHKVLEETNVAKIKTPPVLGTWKSGDGQGTDSFFSMQSAHKFSSWWISSRRSFVLF